MTEFTEAIKLLKDLGVIQIFSIPIAFIVFLYLVKKFLLNGSGQTISQVGVFLKTVILDYMQSEKDRVKSQTTIDFKLGELCEKFNEIAEGLWDNRRKVDDKIGELGSDLREHIAETRNLLFMLKKRNEPMSKDPLSMVDTQYFTQGEQKT
jgi:hypothetical protein